MCKKETVSIREALCACEGESPCVCLCGCVRECVCVRVIILKECIPGRKTILTVFMYIHIDVIDNKHILIYGYTYFSSRLIPCFPAKHCLLYCVLITVGSHIYLAWLVTVLNDWPT